MPSKKAKQKSGKTKKPVVVNQIEKDAARATNWPQAVNAVCHSLEIPDLSNIHHLNECINRMDEICDKLNAAFDQASAKSYSRGAIVAIWGILAHSESLRGKVVCQGVLKRIASVLNDDQGYSVALQSLVIITKFSGMQVLVEVAKIAAPAILATLQKHSSDRRAFGLAITVLSQMSPSIAIPVQSAWYVCQPITMKDLLQVAYSGITRHDITPPILNQAYQVVVIACLRELDLFEKNSSVLDFFTAALRAPAFSIRATNLAFLFTLKSLPLRAKDPPFNDLEVQKAWSSMPKDIDELCSQGKRHCETLAALQATRLYDMGIEIAAQSGDYFQLGQKLFEAVCISDEGLNHGMLVNDHHGLPFQDMFDAIPLAVKALRDRNPIIFREMADAIECKYQFWKNNMDRARDIIEAGLLRKKDAYLYLMLVRVEAQKGREHNMLGRLKWAKLGLRYPSCPILQFPLLVESHILARDAAMIKISKMISDRRESPEDWHFVQALLQSALEDALVYVKEGPVDSRRTADMIVFAILLTVALKGAELSLDLNELTELKSRLADADKIASWLYGGIGVGASRRILYMILERSGRAAKFWDPRFQSIFSKDFATGEPKQLDVDSLADRLDKSHLWEGAKLCEEACDCAPAPFGGEFLADEKTIARYRCSDCKNINESLKKCGCDNAWYCDAECQKAHWKKHRRQCTLSRV